MTKDSKNQRNKKKASQATAAFAGAVAASAAMAPSAEAVVVAIPGTPVTFTVTSSGIGNQALDVDGVGAPGDLMFFMAGSVNYVQRRAVVAGGSFVATPGNPLFTGSVLPLASGFTIGPTLATGSFKASNANFQASGIGLFGLSNSGLVGFNFAGQSGPEYGWLRIHIDTPPGQLRLRILEGAYENTGAPIRAGQGPAAIPEPSSLALSSLGLLALGAAGVRNYRRRKKELK